MSNQQRPSTPQTRTPAATSGAASTASAAAGTSRGNPFTLEDELDLLSGPPVTTSSIQQQQQQPEFADLLHLNSSDSLPRPVRAQQAAAAANAAYLHGSQHSLDPLQQPSPLPAAAASPVISLRNSIQPQQQQQQPHRTASLGYGDLIRLSDDADHPMDMPAGADATLIMAGQAPAVGAAAAAAVGGRSGGPRLGFRRSGRSGRVLRQEVVGVHGGDAHVPEDEQTRTVQIQTLGGEGVLNPFQRFLRAAGVRRRRAPGAFASNELVTSKYNLLSFIPVNLYQQFKRVANMYFLALICLQAIPGLSPVPWWGTLFPLAVVLAVNGVKEAFDDYWRHKSDETVNHRFVTILKEDGDQRVYWKSLQVGDLVRLSNNDDIPADIVLLASSDPDGLCYVETANLDGETNLKVKFCHRATASFDCAEAFSRAGYFTIECEAPNPRLYSFEGAICCWDFPPTYDPHTTLGLKSSPVKIGHQGSAAAAAAQEVEMAAAAAAAGGGGGGSGWYAAAAAAAAGHDQQQQQQPQRSRSPSPSRRRQQQQQQQHADVDSLSAALGEYGQQVGLVYREPLSASNLLLRGCTLRKTEWIIGAVVFTGPDTKVVRNMLPAPRKVTRLELAMNRVVVVVLSLLGTAAVLLSTANMVWEVRHNAGRDWYLGRQTGWPELSPGIASWLVQIIRFIILMAQAVPISLYVSLETVKVAQCKLLYDRDRAMYYPPEDVPCTSRTTTLNEELGQVQYVLTDKTGTLTQNIMGFVWASIAGKLYGQTAQQQQQATARKTPFAAAAADEAKKGSSSSSSKLNSSGGGGVVITSNQDDQPPSNTPHTIALDPDLRLAAAAASSSSSGDDSPAAVGEFLLALALCNTVVPTVTDQGQLLYQAASPDEEALVAGAAYLGTKLVSRSAAGIEVEVNGQLHRYELLAVLEFSSDRKRMSVIVKDANSHIQLITKGADNVMIARLAGSSDNASSAAAMQPLLGTTTAHLTQMSNAGYRTLIVAKKDLQQQEYDQWAEKYKTACASLVDRNDKVAAVCKDMEKGLVLLGATAVEDKLQDGVPEAIAALSCAGIKVWVLTGDKMETAISIGHTARLLHSQMAIVKVRESDLVRSSLAPPPPAAAAAGQQQQQDHPRLSHTAAAAAGHSVSLVLQQMRKTVTAVKAGQNIGSSSSSNGVSSRDSGTPKWLHLPTAAAAAGVALVIEGAALAVALEPQFEDDLLALCKECTAVICCRVSPMQKAQVAHLLKLKAGAVTLAIGDGANDVSMIQAAHIGVGISGREGRAAVQAADFAFGQFRFLARLLLLHGRQSYLRCREVVLYAFYKNVAYVSCYIFYSFYSGFSAQTIFFPMYIATFNAIWAAYPTLGYGLFEQDVPAHVAMANPHLYDETRCQTDWDFYRAWVLWVVLGIWHGLMCFYIPVRTLATYGAVTGTGTHVTVEYLGTAVMTAIIITVTLRVAIRTTHWTIINHALIWGTLVLWLPFLAILQGLCGSVPGLAPLCGLGSELLGSSGFWLGAVIGAPAAALLLDYTIMVFQRQFAPKASQLLQEVEHLRRKAMNGIALPGTAAAQQQQQLPAYAPDLEQQYRQQQQQVELPAAAVRPQQPGGGIIAVAHVPAAAASAAGHGEAANGSPSGSMQLISSSTPAAAGGGGGGGGGANPYDMWGPSGYAGLGADYNLGGPHTLGDIAAVEWAPNVITASPQTLAASHTKRQLKAPMSTVRHGGLAAAAAAGQAGSSTWGNLGRTVTSTSGAFGAAIQMQQLPASTSGHRQQQQQVSPSSPAAAAVGSSRLRRQQQQQQQPVRHAGAQFTLGGDDVL